MYKAIVIFSFFFFSEGLLRAQTKWTKWEIVADTLLNRQQFSKAVKYYTKVINTASASDTTTYFALYKRAMCLYNLTKIEDALLDLQQVTEKFPYFVQAYLLKAHIYADEKNTQEQLKSLEVAYAVNPDNPMIGKLIASVYMDMGEYEKVKEHMFRLKAVHDDPEIESYLAFAYYGLNDIESTLISLNKAIELDIFHTPSYIYAASFCVEEEAYSMAMEYIDAVLKLNPDNMMAWYYKGVIFIEMNKRDKGCQYLAKAFYNGEEEAADYLKEYCYTLTD